MWTQAAEDLLGWLQPRGQSEDQYMLIPGLWALAVLLGILLRGRKTPGKRHWMAGPRTSVTLTATLSFVVGLPLGGDLFVLYWLLTVMVGLPVLIIAWRAERLGGQSASLLARAAGAGMAGLCAIVSWACLAIGRPWSVFTALVIVAWTVSATADLVRSLSLEVRDPGDSFAAGAPQ